MNTPKIVLLAGKGTSTNIVYHYLSQYILFEAVIIEDAVPKKEFIKKRIKKLGLVKVIGQLFFQFLIIPILNFTSKKRQQQIIQENGLNTQAISKEKVAVVPSVNSDACLEMLKRIKPDIIVVNGTRIISKKILTNLSAKIINTHAGITPKYRGVHGGYWALVNNDFANCGVTIHFVDAGIDTGSVIAQQTILPTKQDNFTTYPLLQLAAGLPFLHKAITDISSNTITTSKGTAESALWTHPTIGQYLKNYFSQRIA
jgi:methionyl-tRNA formyltransferase